MKKILQIICALALTLIPVGAGAQAVPPDNHIECFSFMASGYPQLFNKMERVIAGENEKVRIVYLGDSHVQGGVLTNRLRNDFVKLSIAGDGGFGLVFPFVAAGSHNPWGYRTSASGSWHGTTNISFHPDSDLGLQGMAATAELSSEQESSFTISVGTSGGPRYQFNTLDVYGYGSDRDTRPVAVVDGSVYEPYFYQNDSIYTIDLPRPTSDVTIVIKGKTGTFTTTGVRLDNYMNMRGFTLSGCGVNGASLDSWLRCKDLARDFKRDCPDIVVLALGTNDAYNNPDFSPEAFKRKYRRIADMVLDANPDCALLFISAPDNYCRGASNPNGPLVQKAMSELAADYNAGFWDLFNLMGGEGSMGTWVGEGLAQGDYVHFTWTGYEKIADMMFEAILKMKDEYKKRFR